MSVKKFISVILISIAFCLVFNVAKAATVEELWAQIIKLQEQIAQLQKQLAELQGKPAAWCHDFNVNLKIGDSGPEVEALQTALEKEGFDVSKDPRGYFGEYTASAVVGFQEKYKDEILTPWGLTHGTGFVGKTTRAKLNKLYGCGIVSPPVQPYIRVLSPNGGERWIAGNTYEIKWESRGIEKVYISITDMSTPQKYVRLIRGLGEEVEASKGSFYWSIPKNIFNIYPDWKPGDNFRIIVCEAKPAGACGIYDENDDYFTILLPPTTCTDSDGGRNYYVKGTAIDPDTGKSFTDYCLSDSTIREYFCLSPSLVFPGGSVAQEDYTCPYGCKDGACIRGKSITVLSPNGGEKWIKGNTYEIRWKAEGIDRIGIDVVNFDTNTVYTLVTAPNDLPASLGKYSWKVGSEYPEIPPGDHYKIRIFTTFPQEFISDESDGYFSIVSAPEKSITVLSPNGGEKWVFGIPQTITWSSVGIDKVVIYLWFPDGATCKLADNVPAADGKYTVTIKENQQCPNIPRTITAGQYKIGIWSVEPALDISAPHDYSDDYFSIVSGGTPIGSLTVSLSPDIPRNQTFIKGQKEAKLAKINFTAGPEEDIKVILVEINIDIKISPRLSKLPRGAISKT
jgi:hypothetical protein